MIKMQYQFDLRTKTNRAQKIADPSGMPGVRLSSRRSLAVIAITNPLLKDAPALGANQRLRLQTLV
jgi:hypothetical protein